MATTKYLNAYGNRVPSVTTVIGKFKGSMGMVYSAWNLGMKGINFREEWDHKRDIGSCTHEIIEAALLQQEYNSKFTPVQVERAKVGFESWRLWAKDNELTFDNPELFDAELHMVSNVTQCGGTPDLKCYVPTLKKTMVLDWKTSPTLYDDYKMQIAAYLNFWAEIHPRDPLEAGGIVLLRTDEPGYKFVVFSASELNEAWEKFKALRLAYELDLRLTKTHGAAQTHNWAEKKNRK